MASDVVVMECPRCGRLWVGSYENDQHSFNQREMKQLSGDFVHAIPEDQVTAENGYRTRCVGTPESVHRAEVMAAFHLGGKEAAELLVDGSLRRAIEAYEERTRGT